MSGEVCYKNKKVKFQLDSHGILIISDKPLRITFASLASVDKKICRVILLSKSLVLVSLSFEVDKDALAFYTTVEKAMNSITCMEQLYAFNYEPDYSPGLAKTYDPEAEYKRLMVNTNQWRFSNVNANFTVSLKLMVVLSNLSFNFSGACKNI
jgi:hypothetical protein